jgi:4-hydroxybenzoate polyprenyltransferase
MFFILYATAYILTAYFTDPSVSVALGPKFLAGFIAVYFLFFRLRVFDEHKDYEKDCIYHPQRILQSGLISLHDLRSIAAVGLLLEIGISLWFSLTVFLWWLLAFVYSLLMAKEFFVGKWLEQKLVLYALSHMLIMPLMVIWMGSMALQDHHIPSRLLLVGLLCFFSGMAFEISRKIKAPEDEVEGVPTYSSILGVRMAPLASFGCLLVSSALLAYILYDVGTANWVLMLVPVLLVLCALIFAGFVTKPTAANAKKLELGSSLFMLAAYILLIAATLYKTGIRWV